MQVGQNNNTSFGFNAIKFLDEGAEQVFNKKNSKIKPAVLQQALNEIKNLKPTVGSDVDVFVCAIDKGGKKEASYLTYKEKGSLIRKGCVQLNEIKNHTVDGLKEAFQKLSKQVDETRLMEKEYYEEWLRNPLKNKIRQMPAFMREQQGKL